MDNEKIYKWKRKPKNAPKAEVAGRYIEKVRRKRRGVTAQLLVIEAQSTKSPLHDCFEWNDGKAAEKYREQQAREILRMIVVEITPAEGQDESRYVRAFISPVEVEQEDNTSYISIEEVRNDEQLDLAYRRQLKRELDAIKQKIKNYKEFAAVVKAIEMVKI